MLYNHNNNNIALHKHQTAPGVSQIFKILFRTKCCIHFDNFFVFEIRLVFKLN